MLHLWLLQIPSHHRCLHLHLHLHFHSLPLLLLLALLVQQKPRMKTAESKMTRKAGRCLMALLLETWRRHQCSATPNQR